MGSVDRAINFSRFLIWIGLIDIDGGSVVIPYTEADGESKEVYENYVKIVERIADLEKMIARFLLALSLSLSIASEENLNEEVLKQLLS